MKKIRNWPCPCIQKTKNEEILFSLYSPLFILLSLFSLFRFHFSLSLEKKLEMMFIVFAYLACLVAFVVLVRTKQENQLEKECETQRKSQWFSVNEKDKSVSLHLWSNFSFYLNMDRLELLFLLLFHNQTSIFSHLCMFALTDLFSRYA